MWKQLEKFNPEVLGYLVTYMTICQPAKDEVGFASVNSCPLFLAWFCGAKGTNRSCSGFIEPCSFHSSAAFELLPFCWVPWALPLLGEHVLLTNLSWARGCRAWQLLRLLKSWIHIHNLTFTPQPTAGLSPSIVCGIKAMGPWDVTECLVFCNVSSVSFMLKDVDWNVLYI